MTNERAERTTTVEIPRETIQQVADAWHAQLARQSQPHTTEANTMKRTIKTLTIALTLVLSSTAFAAPKADAPKPAASSTPELIHVADCHDGKAYYARTNEHRGACSGHGGVASWADGSPVRSKGGKTTQYR